MNQIEQNLRRLLSQFEASIRRHEFELNVGTSQVAREKTETDLSEVRSELIKEVARVSKLTGAGY